MDWFIESAQRNKLSGRSLEDICDKNAAVAADLNRVQVKFNKNAHPGMIVTSTGSFIARQLTEYVKYQLKIFCFETQLETASIISIMKHFP